MTKVNIILTIIIAGLVGLCVFLYMRPVPRVDKFQHETFSKIDSIQKKLDSLQFYVNIYIPPKNVTKVRVDSFYNIKAIYDKDSLLQSLNLISSVKIIK